MHGAMLDWHAWLASGIRYWLHVILSQYVCWKWLWACQSLMNVVALTKWMTFCWQHFQTHFAKWQNSYFHFNFYQSLFEGQLALVQVMVQQQTDKPLSEPWNNVNWDLWHHIALQGHHEFISSCLCKFNPLFKSSGRVTHICVSKLPIIGSDNGLSPGRRQAVIWTNAGILLIGPLGTNFSEIMIEIHTFSFKKMNFKMSRKWWPSRLTLNVSNASPICMACKSGHHCVCRWTSTWWCQPI